MQDSGSELRRIPLLRRLVNKGKRKGPLLRRCGGSGHRLVLQTEHGAAWREGSERFGQRLLVLR